MTKDWAATFVEAITSPISKITDLVDDIAGTPPHERFSNVVKRDVFSDSHFRENDKISTDKSINPGNILRVSRGWYWHYGVYVGQDEVVHFTSDDGDTSSNNEIMKTSTSRFIRDSENIEILGFPDEVRGQPIYTREETCKRALSQVGRSDYSLFNNNCQHFALWCKTGVAFSGQTYLVNGGESDSYTAALAMGLFGKRNQAVARDLLGVLGVGILRVVFATDYTPR